MDIGALRGARILVTGGAGFIGSHVTEALLRADPAQVTVLDSLVRGQRDNLRFCEGNSAFSFVQGDICDEELVRSCMRQTDYCLHFAAPKVPYCEENPAEATDVLVRGTVNVVEAARENEVRKLVFPSSVLVYGSPSRIPTPETESPYDAATVYAAGKFFGEQFLRAQYRRHGLRSVVLRYFNVYGPRMNANANDAEVIVRWMHALRVGHMPQVHGDGNATLDLVHVRDVVSATIAALCGDVCDERINIASGTEVSLNDLLTMLCQAMRLPVSERHMGGESHVGRVARRCADITKASALLGYAPAVSLREGLDDVVAWFETQVTSQREVVGVS